MLSTELLCPPDQHAASVCVCVGEGGGIGGEEQCISVDGWVYASKNNCTGSPNQQSLRNSGMLIYICVCAMSIIMPILL